MSLAIDAPLDCYQSGRLASPVLFLLMMPITLNGIGLRESVYAVLFSLEARPSEKGVLIGLLFFPQMFVISAFGGVVRFSEGD